MGDVHPDYRGAVVRIVSSIVAVLSLAAPLAIDQTEFTLDSLTVPSTRLGTQCSLPSSSTIKLDDKRVRHGMWVGLPISSNPYRGSDNAAMAAIHGRIAPPAEVPDGPPMSQRELAYFRAKLARDVEEAYAAMYDAGADDLVSVYAVRFKDLREVSRLRASPKLGASVRIVGRTAFIVTGRPSECFDLVTVHVREVTGR